MTTERVTFEQMPSMMAELIDSVQKLAAKVDSMSRETKEAIENSPELHADAHVPMTIEEVSTLTHIAKGTLYHYTCRGKIPCYKQGRTLFFFKDEILDWMQQERKLYDGDITRIVNEFPPLSFSVPRGRVSNKRR